MTKSLNAFAVSLPDAHLVIKVNFYTNTFTIYFKHCVIPKNRVYVCILEKISTYKFQFKHQNKTKQKKTGKW